MAEQVSSKPKVEVASPGFLAALDRMTGDGFDDELAQRSAIIIRSQADEIERLHGLIKTIEHETSVDYDELWDALEYIAAAKCDDEYAPRMVKKLASYAMDALSDAGKSTTDETLAAPVLPCPFCGHHGRYHFTDGKGYVRCRATADCKCAVAIHKDASPAETSESLRVRLERAMQWEWSEVGKEAIQQIQHALRLALSESEQHS